MAEAVATTDDQGSKKGKEPKEQKKKLGFFGRIGLFFRQVIAELRKVVTPTRSELINYVIVVFVFLIVMMLIIMALDFVFGGLIGWIMTGNLPGTAPGTGATD